jgi:NhaP-type Na+/H+ or K+/H+ antiporter
MTWSLATIAALLIGYATVSRRLSRLNVSGAVVLYAVLSLTVVRMLPVALALLGTGARRPTLAFLGWFGPRGLASIVFAVILLDDTELPHLDTLLLAITVTTALSVYAHGLTARPLTERYTRLVELTPARRAAHDGERARSRAPPARPLARRSTRRRSRRGGAETDEPVITSRRRLKPLWEDLQPALRTAG